MGSWFVLIHNFVKLRYFIVRYFIENCVISINQMTWFLYYFYVKYYRVRYLIVNCVIYVNQMT